jgi:hypothetical protein
MDPESLPFAKYIRTHALVVLIQKGLQMDEIQKAIDKASICMANHPELRTI